MFIKRKRGDIYFIIIKEHEFIFLKNIKFI
jgi:hypothetical protein